MTRDQKQAADQPTREERFLERWSRRKLAARDGAPDASPESKATREPEPPATSAMAMGGQGRVSPRQPAPAEPPEPLPPVESLTFDSDFRAFLQPHVAEDLKRQALKKLLHDPRFNVMDGLDVYIDDYSVPSPLGPEEVRALAHARYIFDPPRTRVNAQGHLEDIPPDEQERLASAAPDAGTHADEEQPRPPAQPAADEEARIEAGAPCTDAVAPMPPAESAAPMPPAQPESDADDEASNPGRNPTR